MSDVQTAAQDGPVGIGGWLILPIIGLCLTPLRALVTLKDYAGLGDAFPLLSGAQQTFIVIEVVISVVVAIGLPVVLILMLFNRKRRFPGLYVFWGIFSVAFLVADLIAVKMLFPEMFGDGGAELLDQGTIQDLFRGFVMIAIWVPYMMISRRVRNTFTQ